MLFSKIQHFSNDFLNLHYKQFNYRGINQKQNNKRPLALEIKSTVRRRQLTMIMERIINLAV